MWRSSDRRKQVERVVDRLVDLLDARPREPIAPHLFAIRRLAAAEQAVASRVLLDAARAAPRPARAP